MSRSPGIAQFPAWPLLLPQESRLRPAARRSLLPLPRSLVYELACHPLPAPALELPLQGRRSEASMFPEDRPHTKGGNTQATHLGQAPAWHTRQAPFFKTAAPTLPVSLRPGHCGNLFACACQGSKTTPFTSHPTPLSSSEVSLTPALPPPSSRGICSGAGHGFLLTRWSKGPQEAGPTCPRHTGWSRTTQGNAKGANARGSFRQTQVHSSTPHSILHL